MSPRRFQSEQPELMDVIEEVTPEFVCDLKNLGSLNRWFGSHRLVEHYLQRFLRPNEKYRLLDLCTGFGDIPRFIIDWGKRHHCKITIDALDFQPVTLAVAKAASVDYPQINFITGDACTFAAPTGTYDGVLCSLALHHFSAEDAIRLLGNMRRLSHGFLLAADLERSWQTTFGVWFITATVFREPMTVYDGRLSAARAFSFTEFAELAASAGWQNPEHSRFLYGRQAIVENFHS